MLPPVATRIVTSGSRTNNDPAQVIRILVFLGIMGSSHELDLVNLACCDAV